MKSQVGACYVISMFSVPGIRFELFIAIIMTAQKINAASNADGFLFFDSTTSGSDFAPDLLEMCERNVTGRLVRVHSSSKGNHRHYVAARIIIAHLKCTKSVIVIAMLASAVHLKDINHARTRPISNSSSPCRRIAFAPHRNKTRLI